MEDHLERLADTEIPSLAFAASIAFAFIGGMSKPAAILFDNVSADVTLGCLLCLVLFGAFRMIDEEEMAGYSESLHRIVNITHFKEFATKGGGLIANLLGWKDEEGRVRWVQSFKEKMGIYFSVILSTKVAWFMTNHHTSQGMVWESFNAKVFATVCNVVKESVENYKNTIWLIGHATSTRATIKWMFVHFSSSKADSRYHPAHEQWLEAAKNRDLWNTQAAIFSARITGNNPLLATSNPLL